MTQPPLCYPHPKGLGLRRPPASDLHETAGLPGNFALDFMAPGGTPVLAPEAGTIFKLSGHDPSEGVLGADIFGNKPRISMITPPHAVTQRERTPVTPTSPTFCENDV